MKLEGHLETMNILVKKRQRKRLLEDQNYLKERRCEDMDWMNLVQGCIEWPALVYMVMNLWSSQRARIFSAS